MAKVLCVLYDDPVDGYPKSYPRDDLPRRLKPFDMHLHYTDRHRLPEAVEKELDLTGTRRPRRCTKSATSSRLTVPSTRRRST